MSKNTESSDNSAVDTQVDSKDSSEAVQKRSQERMSTIFKFNAFKEGIPAEELKSKDSTRGNNGKGSQDGSSQDGDEQGSQTVATASTVSNQSQITEEPKGQDDSSESSQAQDSKKKDWEKEAKSHQSRADREYEQKRKIEQELTTFKTENEQLKTQLQDLSTAIDEFKKNPQEFIARNFPDVAKSFNLSSDPIGAIEKGVIDYRKELDKTFKSQYGEDWQFSETKALEPGTPSFRYRLAVEDKIAQLRRGYEQEVQKREQSIKNRQERITKEKQNLMSKYEFTDEDFKVVDDYMSKNELSYELVAKAVLMDKILERRMSSVPPVNPTTPELTTTGGSSAGEEDKKKFSKGAREVLGRIGVGSHGI
jgi:predicted RNase H-like nuclease (RuvC/YqgF family)